MRRGPRFNSSLLGLITAVLAVGAVIVAFAPPTLPWKTEDVYKVETPGTVGDVNVKTAVEVDGVKVGQVTGMEQQGGRVFLDIQVDHQYSNLLHADAGANIRPHGLLGPKYVQLLPGTQGQLQPGATIPASRVHVSVDVDQVVNSLQPDVRQSLQTFLTEFGTGAEDNGDNVNAGFKAVGQSAQDLTTTTNVLKNQQENLADFFTYSERINNQLQYAPISQQITDTDTVLAGLVTVEDHIGGDIDHTANVARDLNTILDGNAGNLQYVLAHLPTTINEVNAGLASGTTILNGVNPCVPDLW